MYSEIAQLAGLIYYPLVTRRPRRRVADLGAAAGPTGWHATEEPAFVAKCESNASHPSHLDAAWVSGIPCGTGKDMYADVDYAHLSFMLQQALDDVGCRDSYCAEKIGGPYVYMKTAAGREGRRGRGDGMHPTG